MNFLSGSFAGMESLEVLRRTLSLESCLAGQVKVDFHAH